MSVPASQPNARRTARRAAAALVLLAAAVTLAGVAPPAAATSLQPTLDVVPTVARPDSMLALTGQGWPKPAASTSSTAPPPLVVVAPLPFTCEIAWASELPAVSGLCKLDDGQLTGSLRVPPDALAGERVIVACWPTCEEAGVQRTTTMTVALPVRVPRLKGQTYPEVVTSLTAVGLVLDQGSAAPDDLTAKVVTQDPLPDTEVDLGSSVSVSFAVQPPAKTVTVPNLVGLSRTEAQVAVGADGLLLRRDPTGPNKGHVKKQQPTAGTRVIRGSTVTVLLATIKTGLVPVPNLVGLSDTRAQAAVDKLGLLLRLNEVRLGQVESQVPVAGTLVPIGTTVGVQLVASVGPDPGPSRWWLVALAAAALLIAGATGRLVQRVRRRGTRWVSQHVEFLVNDVTPTYDVEGDPPEHTVALVPEQGQSRIEVLEMNP